MLVVATIEIVAEPPLRLTLVEMDAQFEATYVRHFRDVYRYVLGLTRSHDEADDITAETFERALQTWKSPSDVPPAPLPWLLLTSRQIAIDRWRRVKRFTRLARRVRNVESTAREEQTEFWMWFEAVARVLSERQREVCCCAISAISLTRTSP